MIGFAVVALVALLAVGFLVLSVRVLWQWRGVWRWLAALPLILVVSVVFTIVTAISQDPTAHNLWPIELLAWFAMAWISMGVLAMARWLTHRFVA